MKSFIIFILLGVFAFLISLTVLSNILTPTATLYISSFLYLVIVSIYFLTTVNQNKYHTSTVYGMHEHRKTPRYHVAHYPGEVTIPDGSKMSVLLNDVSTGGCQVLCAETAEYKLVHKIHNIEKNKSSKIELFAHIPLKERAHQIRAKCMVAHISKNKKEVFSVAAGLQIMEYLDGTDDVMERLIQELTPSAA